VERLELGLEPQRDPVVEIGRQDDDARRPVRARISVSEREREEHAQGCRQVRGTRARHSPTTAFAISA
jgi:hypothetical protein